MPTDYLIRGVPSFSQTNYQHFNIQEASKSPLAYENLQIVKKLSKGKFPIYLTSSKITNQTYAMKVFNNDVKDPENYYKNEIRFAYLNHPNVINIVHHQSEKTSGSSRVTYVLSEYAAHGDFFDFIINHKDGIDDKLVRTYFRQLIEGLEYLHANGVAHLDIKPENLLLDADFNLKIADFDLSYVANDEKVLSRGTRHHRGPELYNSTSSKLELELPSAADIYSAGITLFIMMSRGVYPHAENQLIEGINFTELMHKNSKKFWTKHSELEGKGKTFYDSNFRELFHKMVKANPKKRPTIKKIKQSKWYNGPVYTPIELALKMKTILNC